MSTVAVDPRRNLHHRVGGKIGQRAVVEQVDHLDVGQSAGPRAEGRLREAFRSV